MKAKTFFKNNPYTAILLVFMVAVLLIFTVAKGNVFWKPGTWKGIIMQFPEFGVMATGTMLCFILGCIDMSFVMMGNFATICGVRYILGHVTEGMSRGQTISIFITAILIVAMIGAIGGIINGLLISKLGIPPVIATISMQMVWLGLSTGVTNGETLSLKSVPLYAEIGHSNVLGFIPFPLFSFIIIFVIVFLLLHFTTYGKKLYMCGTNRKAARFSAINTDRMIVVTFVIADVICCIGSLLMVSTLNSAKADSGESYVMKIVLILVLAGILPDGGIGKMGNLIISILIIQIITSGVNMFSNMNTYHASFIYAALLIVVLILSTFLSGDRRVGRIRKKVKEKTA